MRETLPGISRNQMRETPTSAHLISCYLTDGRSISFLRQNARAQKARKLGLSGLLASFLYMNFALLIGQIYVLFRVLNDGFHRGKKSGLMHVVAEGGWGKTETVLPKNGSQSFSCTHARHVGIPRQCGGFS